MEAVSLCATPNSSVHLATGNKLVHVITALPGVFGQCVGRVQHCRHAQCVPATRAQLARGIVGVVVVLRLLLCGSC